jgi:NAD(P)-dependent dehydrogenase (short-subunit alcohol dehydrogenase family)
VIEVNLNGTANTVRAVVPHMIERQHGRIIIIASGQGRHGMKNGAAYSASKWALIGFMKSIALELAEHKITVNTIEPGLVDTALTRNTERWNEALKPRGAAATRSSKGSRRDLGAHEGRSAESTMDAACDIAPAAVFLASNAAAWVSGATYDVTAGDSGELQPLSPSGYGTSDGKPWLV